MMWRSSTSITDRVLASLPYLLPLMDAILGYGGLGGPGFFHQFPSLTIVLLPLMPLLTVYQFLLSLLSFGGMSLGGLILFFGLFFLVVRNESISSFIRFNTMQSIIIGIALSIFGVIWQFALGPIFGMGLIADTLFITVFFAAVAASVYSIVQTLLGRDANIPTLSDAAATYVR